MVVLAALIPLVMLAMVLALGRYEELMLPDEPLREGTGDRLEPLVRPAAASAPAPAGIPAPSP